VQVQVQVQVQVRVRVRVRVRMRGVREPVRVPELVRVQELV
jgi:hypothetical protein